MLSWGLYRNLENSFKYFLDTEIQSDSVTDSNGDNIPVRIGMKLDNNWSLPCISIYVESETDNKIFIGSNFIDDQQLIIIDIYATNEGERTDIANWITQKIKDGWTYYEYSPNLSNPTNPVKVKKSLVNVQSYLSNGRVRLNGNTNELDAHRHRITINVLIPNA